MIRLLEEKERIYLDCKRGEKKLILNLYISYEQYTNSAHERGIPNSYAIENIFLFRLQKFKHI